MTVEPARLDIKTLRRRRNHLVSVATKYQLGLVFHAGSLIAPLNAATPHGTCESDINAALSASTSAANEARNFVLSRTESRPAVAISAARELPVVDSG